MESKELQHWMSLALDQAKQAAAQDEIPIGCVIVHENKVLAQGMNLRELTHKTTAHAEIVALEKFNLEHQTWRLPENSWVFITAEPCLMCSSALLWARAHHIVFGCSDPRQAGLIRIKDWIEQGIFDHRFEKILGGILENECGQVLKDYFKSKRKPVL